MPASSGSTVVTTDSKNFVRQRDGESAAAPAQHPLYRIHWRTEINWRAAHIEFVGHLDLPSLTPETACENFADKFPDREIIRLVAL